MPISGSQNSGAVQFRKDKEEFCAEGVNDTLPSFRKVDGGKQTKTHICHFKKA